VGRNTLFDLKLGVVMASRRRCGQQRAFRRRSTMQSRFTSQEAYKRFPVAEADLR